MKSTRQDNYDKLLNEWKEADAECRRLYTLWQAACVRQDRLARQKNRAWNILWEEKFATSSDTGQAG